MNLKQFATLKTLTLVSFFLFAFSFFMAGSALAKVVTSENSAVIPQDEVIDEDLFVGAGSVVVNGTVNGNLFVGGGQVKITGTINGSAFVGGGVVDVSGEIKDNLVVGAGNVTLTGARVGNGVIAGVGTFSIDADSKIGGGLVAGAGSLDLNASVGKGILAGGGVITINSRVEKDILVSTDQLVLGKGADLSGNLTYVANQKAQISSSSKIAGATKFTPAASIKRELPQSWLGTSKKISFAFNFFSYLSTLLVGLVIVYLFPRGSQRVAGNILEKPWKALGSGFLILVLALPALIFLGVSIVGIPLAILGLIFWGISIYIARIFVGLLFGQSLFEVLGKKDTGIYLNLVLGLAVYFVLAAIPILGWFVSLAAVTFGLGALFLCERNFLVNLRASH